MRRHPGVGCALSAHLERVRHDPLVPAGLDGNRDPDASPARNAVLDALAAEVRTRRSSVLLVAIDGIDGAGKTTFADELGRRIRDMRISVIRSTIDSFHRPRCERWARGKLSDVGFYFDSHNLDAVRRELLDPLRGDPPEAFRAAVFDETSDSAVDSPLITPEPGAVLLFDGLFLQRPELIGYWDFVIYVDGERRVSEARIARALDGCPPGVDGLLHLARFWAVLGRYVGGFRLYVDECAPALRADAVVDNNDFVSPTLVLQPGGHL